MSDTHIDLELLSAYLDGEASAPERQAVDAHLAGCPACSARKGALAGVVSALAALPEAPPTPGEAAAIRRAVTAALPRAAGVGAAGAGAAGVGAAGVGAAGVGAAGVRAAGSSREGWAAGWRRRFSLRLYAAAGAVALLVVGLGGYAVLRPAGHSVGTAAGPVSSPAPPPTGAPASPEQPALAPRTGAIDLGSSQQARAYAAAMPGVSQALGVVDAVSAPTATARFFAGLALPAPSGTAGGTQGFNVATPAPLAVSGAGPDAATLGTLTGCMTQVLASLPAPAVPLAGTGVTYQGQAAWLLVAATAAPGAPAGQPLGVGNAFVMSRPWCTTLDHSTFTR